MLSVQRPGVICRESGIALQPRAWARRLDFIEHLPGETRSPADDWRFHVRLVRASITSRPARSSSGAHGTPLNTLSHLSVPSLSNTVVSHHPASDHSGVPTHTWPSSDLHSKESPVSNLARRVCGMIFVAELLSVSTSLHRSVAVGNHHGPAPELKLRSDEALHNVTAALCKVTAQLLLLGMFKDGDAVLLLNLIVSYDRARMTMTMTMTMTYSNDVSADVSLAGEGGGGGRDPCKKKESNMTVGCVHLQVVCFVL